ncbi:MAG: hypothetical protein ACR2N5_04770 [Solirubrobacterales bacterium]
MERPNAASKSSRKRTALWAGAAVAVAVIVVVVVALLVSSDGDEASTVSEAAPPADGDCGMPLGGERSQDQVLVSGEVNCETAVKVIEGLDDAPSSNPGLVGAGKTVTVDGTEWSCGPPTPSVECESAEGTVTDEITPGS